MLARLLVAVTFGLAACAPARAADIDPAAEPLVLGDLELAPEVGPTEPGSVIVEEGVPTEPPAASALVEDPPTDGVGCTTPGPVTTCIDDGPGWCSFTVVDALFMQRTNTVGPLAVAAPSATDAGSPVIAAGDVRYPVAPGVRVFQGWRGPDAGGFEVGYLGVWGMHADAMAVSPGGSLALPGQLGLIAGSGLDSATAIEPVLHGSLNSVECNVFATRIHDGCRRHDPLPWRRSWGILEGTTSTADWLLGVRWAGLDETAMLAVTALAGNPPPVFNTTDYRVTTSSQLIGPQIGHRRRVDWGDWAVEGWAKAGLMAALRSQSQGAVVGPFDLVQVRGPTSSSSTGVGMIGDLNAAVVRRFGDHWGLRAGYTVLWFTGVAPAANQWDFSDTPTSGTGVNTGTVFLHGATLGLEATW
jgi:hypothetical protein